MIEETWALGCEGLAWRGQKGREGKREGTWEGDRVNLSQSPVVSPEVTGEGGSGMLLSSTVITIILRRLKSVP